MPKNFNPDPIDRVAKDSFVRLGYTIIEILHGDELRRWQHLAEATFKRLSGKSPPQTDGGSWRVSVVHQESDGRPFQSLITHPSIIAAVETLLGPEPIFEGGALIMAPQENQYRQGWHRDVLQIPEEFIDDRRFSSGVFHNAIQLNLPLLTEDSSFWAVPASHHRPLTAEEAVQFSGSKHSTPVSASMPGELKFVLSPGQGIFYNNNILHRGYNEQGHKRLTFHASYHSARHRPTWHFYNPGFGTLSATEAALMDPDVHEMWIKHQERKRLYPRVEDSFAISDD